MGRAIWITSHCCCSLESKKLFIDSKHNVIEASGYHNILWQ